MNKKDKIKTEELLANSSGASTDTIIKDTIITTVDTESLYHRIGSDLGHLKKLFIGWDSEFNSAKGELYSYQFAWYCGKQKKLKTRFFENIPSYEIKMTWESFQKLIKKVTDITFTKDGEVYLLCHYSTAEISTIYNFFSNFTPEDKLIDFGKYGTYTFKSSIFKTLKICDTLNFQKSRLSKIGQAIGIPKIDFQTEVEKLIPEYKKQDKKAIECYGDLLRNSLTRKLAIAYGLRDSEICLKFALTIVELMRRETGKIIIVETLPAATEKIFIDKYVEYEDKKESSKNNKGTRGEALGHEKVIFQPEMKKGAFIPYKKPYYRERLFKQIRDLGENVYQGGRNQTYFNGIVKQTCYDFDIKGAYTVPLRLIKGLKFIRFEYDGNLFKRQTREFDLERFKTYLNNLDDENMLTLQGTFTGAIFYKPIYVTPTLINLKNNLAECLIDNSQHHILELVVLLRYYPQVVDGQKTVIRGISLFETSSDYIFREYINYLVGQRSKYPKGSVFNVVYKLLNNAFYGKLAQGIRGEYRGNIITEKKEKMPESRIFNPLFASYITAYIRLMTFEAAYSINNSANKDKREGVLNVITDGCLLTGQRKPLEYIRQFDNLPFMKQTRQLLGIDSLGELKHTSQQGHIIPKVRVDFPLYYEERGEKDDSDMKIASPSGYSKELSKKDTQNELKELYLKKPKAIISNRRLQSYRDIFENPQLLKSIYIDKTINGNLQASKNVQIFLNNDIYQGAILTPFSFPRLTLTSYLRNHDERRRNEFLAYQKEQVENYMRLNQIKVKIRNKTKFSRYGGIVNDLIYELHKRYKHNLTYNELIDNLKSQVKNENFRIIKKRCIGYKIQVLQSSIHQEFEGCLRMQLYSLNIHAK